eukprot:COSAG01_NODE_32132_length_586_cov_0.634497_1_plen_105_part_10
MATGEGDVERADGPAAIVLEPLSDLGSQLQQWGVQGTALGQRVRAALGAATSASGCELVAGDAAVIDCATLTSRRLGSTELQSTIDSSVKLVDQLVHHCQALREH